MIVPNRRCAIRHSPFELLSSSEIRNSSLKIVLAVILFATLALPVRSAEPTSALGGWSEVEITPPLGIGLGGRGSPETTAKKILDPLFAQVLYLKDARGKGFVVASFDLVGMPHDLGDRLRNDIVNELGVEWDLVVLNTSHTHSGPYMIRSLMAGVGPAPQIEIDYFNTLEQKIISATRAAKKSLQPVSVEVFNGTSDVGINRRGKNKQGKRSIIPDPNGPYDERVWVMKLTPKSGGAPAVLFSYACHPVIVYGYAFAGVSADFPGVTRNTLREALGKGSHAQFVQGFAGNIRPRVVADLAKNQFRGSKPADLQAAGKSLAESVLAAIKTPGEKLSLNIAGTFDRPFLPRAEPPPRQVYEQMRKTGLATTNHWQLAVSDFWLKRYDAGEGFAKGDPWALGLVRLADHQWIVHSGGEPCVEWRAKMNEWLAPYLPVRPPSPGGEGQGEGGLPLLNIVTWGYAEAKSYLPTESMLPEGGYEVLDSNNARASTPAPYAPGIEAAIHESLVRQLAFIRAKAD